MTKQHQHQQEKGKSLESHTYLHARTHLFQKFVFTLHEFEKTEKSCDFDQLIEFAQSGDSNELIRLSTCNWQFLTANSAVSSPHPNSRKSSTLTATSLHSLQNSPKRHYSQQINQKPPFSIGQKDHLPVVNHFKNFILVRTIEINDYVHPEEGVNDVVEQHVRMDVLYRVGESEVDGGYETGDEENQGHDRVPVNFFPIIGRINQKRFPINPFKLRCPEPKQQSTRVIRLTPTQVPLHLLQIIFNLFRIFFRQGSDILKTAFPPKGKSPHDHHHVLRPHTGLAFSLF